MPVWFLFLRHSIEYNIGRYKLTINIWFLIIFLLVQTGLNELGFWQLDRAQQKQSRIDSLKKTKSEVLHSLDLVNRESMAEFSRIELATELAENSSILIENKIQNGSLGYHVLNLVRDLKSGRFVLVNRGWIDGNASRNEWPRVKLPEYYWTISGRVYKINPEILSKDANIENQANLIRLPVLDVSLLTRLEKRFNINIKPFLIRLDSETENTFDVNWVWNGVKPEKHLAYAFQWFGLSFTFLIVSLIVLIKKKPRLNLS